MFRTTVERSYAKLPPQQLEMAASADAATGLRDEDVDPPKRTTSLPSAADVEEPAASPPSLAEVQEPEMETISMA